MSRKRALSIVKNLNRTISSMIDVKVIPNEQFPGVRANKQKLNSIKDKLLKKYDIREYEYKINV
jgi:hypothetical protein|tara:strand:- start:322 stop:513 length:192 start_codon:yes stop_codon:yes gene_type:complete